MPDAMLFGAGWNGDVWTIEERADSLDLFHRPEMCLISSTRDVPPIKYARFIVDECLINGAVYLIGYHGEKPTDEKKRWAYHYAERKPTRLDRSARVNLWDFYHSDIAPLTMDVITLPERAERAY